MLWNIRERKKKAKDHVCGLKTQRAEKSKKEKKLAQRNKGEETMASREGKTRKIAGGLVRPREG